MARNMMRLAWRELMQRPRGTAGLALGVSVVLLVFLAIQGMWAGIQQTLSQQDSQALVVVPKDGLGFWGNAMPLEWKTTLRGLGAEWVAPQVFATRQQKPGQPILLRGVPLNDGSAGLARITGFQMRQGLPLERGDRDKVMVGAELAISQKLAPGDPFKLMGKTFTVKGVFVTGHLADSEVWMDLEEAQRLLRSQGTVSTFSVTGPPGLADKISRRMDLEVTSEKKVWESLNGAFASLDGVMSLASVIVAGAAILGVMNTIFTIVQQRRREIAILRSMGFNRRAVLVYVLSQSLFVALAGLAVAVAASLILLRFMRIEAAGMSIVPALTAASILRAFGLTLAIGILAGLYPALRAARLHIAQTLREG